ncbi:NUDIX hydrolase [Ectobacillus panaciterrae]|uniref:NUDIX hydrolase n=1 Tax=Ectobacillus panaciterrae TaxID=363872 RepID=UPI0003F85E1B|nr:NUDIX domain-containing protein [Ectobacillus panaciterrae]
MNELYKKKVYAYVTREKEENIQLLVHTHRDVPEAGVQVPGGTVENGESLEEALLREILEESGLKHIAVEDLVADELIYVKEKDEYQKRYFYHVTLTTDVKEEWSHTIACAGEDNGLVFCYKWIGIEEGLSLAGKQGAYVHHIAAAHKI